MGTYRELGEAAWAWVLNQVGEDDGPWLPVAGSDRPGEDRDPLYAGIAGLAPILARDRVLPPAEELDQHRG